jgi:hypothetical protein
MQKFIYIYIYISKCDKVIEKNTDVMMSLFLFENFHKGEKQI